MQFIAPKMAAQEKLDFEQFLHDIIPFEEDRVENLDYYDQLLQIYQNPININKATKIDLEKLYLLNQNQINQIINYRNEYGDFLSIYELQAIPDLDLITIHKLKYFISIKSAKADNRKFHERLKEPDRHYLLSRLERQIELSEGYKKSETRQSFLGDPNKYLMRYRLIRYNDYSFGLTFEKDAGELMSWNPTKKQYSFDFISGHLYRENLGIVKKLAIGDYQLQYGQGLIFAAGFGTGKGAQSILSTKQISTGIGPYSSAMESGFQRGIAFSLALNNFIISPFYSRNSIDAAISNADSNERAEITSIATSGLHNTKSNLDKRNSSIEQVYGANIKWIKKSSQVGLTLARQGFSELIEPQNLIRNKFKFKGQVNSNISIDHDFSISNFNIFGETAISSSGGIATVQGLIAALNSSTDLALHYRYLDYNYHSIRGSAFSEGTTPINESGMYLGLERKIRSSIKINAYYDIFSFPWLTYLAKSPSKGNEVLVRVEKRLSRSNSVYIQFKNENKELSSSEDNIPKLYSRKKHEWIFQLSHSVNEVISFRTRVQAKNIISTENSTGMAIIQDLRLAYQKIRIDLRLSVFNTSDYQSRIYVLERDVLYSLSAPAYFGSGIRNYLLIKYKAGRKVNLWLKWGRTLRTDVDNMGSGMSKSLGNKRNSLKFQMILNL